MRISYGAPVTLACGCINGAARPMRMAKPEPTAHVTGEDINVHRATIMQAAHDGGCTWAEVARAFGYANDAVARRFVAEQYRRAR